MAEAGAPPQGSGSPDGEAPAQNVKEQGQQVVGSAAEKAQDAVRTQVDERSTQAGEQLTSAASDLRSVGEQLRGQENDPGAKIAEAVAERAERAGRYLSDADPDRILADAENLGRRQPWLVLAGGIALGIAGARFLKASSGKRYQASSAQATQSGRAGGLPSNATPSQDGPRNQPWDQPEATGTSIQSPAGAQAGATA